uniref:Large ribosomal subunit protein mL40 n=1 Tax=Romanomermis culicivorax TaxID=13658 RepID=A0A915KNV3_ROMCU
MTFLLRNCSSILKFSHQILPQRLLHTTPQILAAPMRKKNKGIGNELMRFREERKLGRIQKEIKRTKAKGRILKPIEECQLDPSIEKELESRRRPDVVLDFEEQERRALLIKEWARCSP